MVLIARISVHFKRLIATIFAIKLRVNWEIVHQIVERSAWVCSVGLVWDNAVLMKIARRYAEIVCFLMINVTLNVISSSVILIMVTVLRLFIWENKKIECQFLVEMMLWMLLTSPELLLKCLKGSLNSLDKRNCQNFCFWE